MESMARVSQPCVMALESFVGSMLGTGEFQRGSQVLIGGNDNW